MIVAEVNSKVLVERTHCGDLWLRNSATLSEPVLSSRRIDLRLPLLGPILWSRIDTLMTEKRNRDDGSMDELHTYCDRSDLLKRWRG